MVFLGVSYSNTRAFSHICIAQLKIRKAIRCKTYSVAKIISSNFTLSIKSLKSGKLVSLFFTIFQ